VVRPEIRAYPTHDHQDNHYPRCQKKPPRAIHADIVTEGVLATVSLYTVWIVVVIRIVSEIAISLTILITTTIQTV